MRQFIREQLQCEGVDRHNVYPTSKAVLKIAADAAVKSVQVVVLKVSGAGDAFVSGFPIAGRGQSSRRLQPVAINTCNEIVTLA